MNFLSTKRRSKDTTPSPTNLPQGDANRPQEDATDQLVRLKKQNTQLIAFADHMCRQIRSVTGNLGLTIELLQQTTDKQERKELLQQVAHVSKTMNQTVDQLNQMVLCSRMTGEQKETVVLSSALSKSIVQNNALIHEAEAEIFSDFSEVSKVLFSTKLLESMFKTIIEYSIINTPETRKPAIDVFSYQEHEDFILLIKDNSDGSIIKKLDEAGLEGQNYNDLDPSILTLNALKLQIEQLDAKLITQANPNVGSSIRIIFEH